MASLTCAMSCANGGTGASMSIEICIRSPCPMYQYRAWYTWHTSNAIEPQERWAAASARGALGQDDVSRGRRRDVLGDFVPEGSDVDPVEQRLAGAQEDRREREVQLVDQARAPILLNRRDTPAEPHVLAGGGLACTRERVFDPARQEVECRIAFHRERLARMARQDEDLTMVRRLVAPPTFPAFVGPRAAHRAEHVAAQDPRAHVREPALRELVVDARRAALVAEHRAQRARAPRPVMELHAADAERILHALAHAGAV